MCFARTQGPHCIAEREKKPHRFSELGDFTSYMKCDGRNIENDHFNVTIIRRCETVLIIARHEHFFFDWLRYINLTFKNRNDYFPLTNGIFLKIEITHFV